jgi:uncharacterized protein DUF6946
MIAWLWPTHTWRMPDETGAADVSRRRIGGAVAPSAGALAGTRQIEALLRSRPELADPVLLLAIAEHRVPLPRGRRDSQNDLWALVQTKSGVISLAIEGKAGEDFDRTVKEWLANREPKSNKEQRLSYLLDTLGITADVSHLRYQLLHRAASAVIEARRFGTKYAAMIVQSFKNPTMLQRQEQQFEDYRSFCSMLGVSDEPGQLGPVPSASAVPLFLGRVNSLPATDEQVGSLEVKAIVSYPKRHEQGAPRPGELGYTALMTRHRCTRQRDDGDGQSLRLGETGGIMMKATRGRA